MIGSINGPYIIDDVASFLPHYFQLVFPARLIMLHLNLQTILIIHSVFIDPLNLLHSLDYELTWVDSLSFASFNTARTV